MNTVEQETELERLNCNNRIYKLKLTEKTSFFNIEILRVPGGWIYTDATRDLPCSCFVPFDNEFMKNDN